MNNQTSLDAYKEIKNNGLLSERRFQVFEAIHHNGAMSQNDLARILHRQYPSIGMVSFTPRFAELKNLGVIEVVGTKIDAVSGVLNDVWDITGNLPTAFKKKITMAQKLRLATKILKATGQYQLFEDSVKEFENKL